MAVFGAGLMVGVLVGFFFYPLFWSWIAWREYRESSERARRIDDVLADMSRQDEGPVGRRKGRTERTNSRLRILRPIGR